MAARKLAQEIDKCFKKVTEGVAEFEAIYEKIEQSNNPAQKEKLEDNLKREIKKLQRLRDQIKTWAASNDIKDKAPLLEQRRLIETQMEKFKAVEKAMKTKAYSKEGLSAAAKLDPKEQAKMEASEFLSAMVDELEQQIETLEAEGESIQATMKKGKKETAKAHRIAEIEGRISRHKFHQGKLELIRRSLENGGVDAEQVHDLEEGIRFYVTDSMNPDFQEDEFIYDDLDLQDEEDTFGMAAENDKGSSQDTQSVQDDMPESEPKPSTGKQRLSADATAAAAARRPSAQLKSPLPTLATIHNPLPSIGNGAPSSVAMKPATAPTQGLKYASAAAAAADKNSVGIAPLPPPPPPPPSSTPSTSMSPFPAHAKPSTTSSPNMTSSSLAVTLQGTGVPTQLPAAEKMERQERAEKFERSPAASCAPVGSVPATLSSIPAPAAPAVAPTTVTAAVAASSNHAEAAKTAFRKGKSSDTSEPFRAGAAARAEPSAGSGGIAWAKAHINGFVTANGKRSDEEEKEESIYHLPASLQDLIEAYEVTKKRVVPVNSPVAQLMHRHSEANKPDLVNGEPPRNYYPDNRKPHSQFPQEPLPIFENPNLYSRIDPDTLFYVFYYKQGTHQQFLAAKALKDQSWRFHKQYQTWFQRHEEPKAITEEFEQGTYRFFDYESTWMNRRKADFKFAYKFLEDDVQ